jgi:hypothetical protein
MELNIFMGHVFGDVPDDEIIGIVQRDALVNHFVGAAGEDAVGLTGSVPDGIPDIATLSVPVIAGAEAFGKMSVGLSPRLLG